MRITYDPAKNERNIRVRSLPFDRAADFDFELALVTVDARKDYGETRYVALGNLDRRLHVLCFTIAPDEMRVISFRKANAREVRRYDKAKAAD